MNRETDQILDENDAARDAYRERETPEVWVVLDDGVPVGVTSKHPIECGWHVIEGRQMRRYRACD